MVRPKDVGSLCGEFYLFSLVFLKSSLCPFLFFYYLGDKERARCLTFMFFISYVCLCLHVLSIRKFSRGFYFRKVS